MGTATLYARLYELLPLASFIFNLFLLSLVLRSDWRSRGNWIFTLFLLTMGLWGLTIFGMRSSPHPDGADLALIWEKAVISTILGVAVFFYHFTLLYTRTKAPKGLLPAFYLLWAVFAGLSIPGLIVSRMDPITLVGGYMGWSARFTSLGVVYLVIGFIPTILGIHNLVRFYQTTRSPETKNRTLYLVAGAGLSLAGATSDFLFAKGIIIYPFGIVANILFASITTVAILRYRLLELRIVLRHGVVYTFQGILIAGLYGAAFVLFRYVFQAQSDFARLLASIGAIVGAAIALQPLLGRFQRLADRWYFRERHDYLQALQQFSLDTKDITNLKSIADSLTGLTVRAMAAHSASLLLPAAQAQEFYVASTANLDNVDTVTLGADSPICSWLRGNEGVLTRNDLEVVTQFHAVTAADWEAIDALRAEFLIPLKAKGQLTGILVVGPKLSEEDYSTADVELLRTVVDQTATAIENARLYSVETARLEELERMEQLKATLLLTVSHELKTPLTAIKAATEMLQLQEDASPSRTKSRLFTSINKGVARLERLIEESLDYSRMQDSKLELNFEPTDLREFYQEIIELATPSIRAKRQILKLNLPESLPMVFVDQRRYERVMLNLLSNANKYTGPEGKIEVIVQQESTYLVTSVIDSGQGIAESELDKIFTVYYRNDTGDRIGAGQSSGLGLTIAKYLVELHGGRIWVDSRVSQGSAFHFTTPIGDRNQIGERDQSISHV